MRWLDGIINSVKMSLSKTPGDGEGQGSLVCCSPWDGKESDTTEQLNNNNSILKSDGGSDFLKAFDVEIYQKAF